MAKAKQSLSYSGCSELRNILHPSFMEICLVLFRVILLTNQPSNRSTDTGEITILQQDANSEVVV